MATSKGSTKQEVSVKVKYSALETNDKAVDEETHEVEIGEQLSLLENMENVSISYNDTKESTDAPAENKDSDAKKKKPVTQSVSKPEFSCKQKSMTAIISGSVTQSNDDNKVDKVPDVDSRNLNRKVSAPQIGEKKTRSRDGSSEGTKLDIVRKMSEPHSENYTPWRKIGPYSVLKQKRCQRVYATSGRADDLALFYNNGKFHIMEAWCSHMGGPLFEGDIEDYNGKCHVMCPWHSYMFDLETGMNEIGLQQNVFELKFENAHIFVRYKSEVSINPLRKPSEVKVIQSPKQTHEKPSRKDSVLETVMKLT